MNILFFLTPKAEVAHIKETDTLRQVLERMEHHGYTAIPVLSASGTYIGTITEGDLLWEMKDKDFPALKELQTIFIGDVPRRRDNEAVKVEVRMEELLDKVRNQNFVPVVDDENVFIGIITRKDVLLYLEKQVSVVR